VGCFSAPARHTLTPNTSPTRCHTPSGCSTPTWKWQTDACPVHTPPGIAFTTQTPNRFVCMSYPKMPLQNGSRWHTPGGPR
jgi:hypothetical protein